MPPVFQKSQPLLALHLALRPSPPPPFALTRAGWKHHLYAAGEREGRRGGRAEREVQSEEGL